MTHEGRGRETSAAEPATAGAPNLGRRMLRGGMRGAFGVAVGHLLMFAQFSVLGRYLSVREFGVFATALGLMQLGLTWATQGVPMALLRFVGGEREPACHPALRSLVRRSAFVVLLGALCVALVVWQAGDMLLLVRSRPGVETAAWSLRPYLPLVAGWLLLAPLVWWFRGLFQGLKWFAWSSFFEKGAVPAGWLSIIGLCWALDVAPPGHRLPVAMWSYLVALVLAVTAGVVVFAPWWRRLAPGTEVWPWGKLLGTAWPLGLRIMLSMLVASGLLWWLGLVASGEQVGYFGAVQRLGAMITLPLVFLTTIMSAFVAELHGSGRLDEMEGIVRTLAFLGGRPGLLGGGAMWALAPWVLRVVFGPDFEEGASALRWLLLGYGLQFLTGPGGMVLAMTGRQRVLLVAAVATVLVSAAVATWTMRFGTAVGAAQALALYLGGGHVVMWVLARRLVGIRCHMRFVAPAEMRRWLGDAVRARAAGRARGAAG